MKVKEKTSKIVIKMIIAIVIAIYVLFPFFLVVINSCKQTADITANPIGFNGVSLANLYQNLSDVINNTHFLFWSAFTSSAVITILSLILLALLGAMAAWVICRNKTKWSVVIYFTFIASMIIPFQVVMLPLISTFRDVGNFVGIPMIQSIPGIVFAYLGFGGAMTVFILNGFIKGIPMELEEAASIDGCSPEQTFFIVILPLLKPVITTVTILNGMWIWNDYLLPSILLQQNGPVKTLPVAVQAFVGSYVKQWNLILGAALLAIIPILILFFIAQKQIMEGMIEGAVKG
ncbi:MULTISPECIES: carbohydrate ABC transporter permease [Pseudobutyrivibrio]|jgi:raffinose/stachyose/melibiose transport system permease protein|uniref:Carbohydrate ABC transporter permease n=1 Tax=Pseudobutyrivibrio ruminis TaxID=46206 RepID=A0A2G3DRV3_9FIRM|nr:MULTISPECIES: carbohydrate ABC transporter permease [Pseudobutyrivibrio]MBQ7470319.1 carbohydrate ABC transporter permease [Pseudobutyrivibrio sp.]MBR5951695.1 carbohydrate ABC transporter permease [Pseudobutyrivibrio sp.]PHU33762.1 carbohydrate ABC transporter permease [Pseudobutyrivibrio ruminis]SCY23024.1 raffinose/stachyose/melibiose transport system permease protein [Pseudobutyrivibrio sp. AR14]